ncbi:hypothetical protein [Rubritalea marina]|uniref:hypothetical protein n=1 Tax=Rubritalea marina TaxID=361055 RepID=UPI0003739863|nr:hypothetical protein [Rubritalea marina]
MTNKMMSGNSTASGLATKPQKSWFALIFIVGFFWPLYRLLMNDGWILDDEISHYYFSRSVWENPEQLFNHWTRPGRNWIHLLVAPLGFTATRVFTLILSALATWMSYRVADRLGLKYAFLIPALLMFQSWFPELCYPVLTQAPFMLVWILGIAAALKSRYHWAGFCFGYLSLIRHEGILLTALWGLWLSFQPGGLMHKLFGTITHGRGEVTLAKAISRDTLYALSTVSAILIYNIAAFLMLGHWPFSIYFESKPTTMYGSGTVYHYVPLLIYGAGFASSLLAAIGLCFLRGRVHAWSLILVSYGFYFVAHSLIYWKGAFASGGYYHFIMPMAPALALLAALGLEGLCEMVKKWRWGSRIQKPLVSCCVACVIFQGFNMFHHQMNYQNWAKIMHEGGRPEFKLIAPPLEQGGHSQTVIEASDWATNQENGRVFAKHVAHNFHQGILATQEQIEAENAALYMMPTGSYYLWDSLYCEFENRIRYASFDESQDWVAVRAWQQEYPVDGAADPAKIYRVVVFQKVSARDTQDKHYDVLGEADKVDQIYE